MPTTIAILGLGAIGTVMAAYLQEAGQHPVVFTRRPLAQVQLAGPDGTHQLTFQYYELSRTTLPEPDWLIVCLKTYHYEGAAPWWPQILNPRTKVAVIRNGLDLQATLKPYLPEQNILPLLIHCPTQQVAKDHYQQFYPARLTGPVAHPLGQAFCELFGNIATLEFEWVADFHTHCWAKLCESAALGALMTIHRDGCRIFADPSILQAYAELLAENIQIARADGAQLPSRFHQQVLDRLLAYPLDKGSSMLTDYLNDKPLELGAKNGAILARARALGIAAPINESLITKLTSR